MNKVTEVTIDGVKFYQDANGNLREPRFLMPEKEAYQNPLARAIRRIGYKQIIIELYLFNDKKDFGYWRFEKNDETLEITKQMFDAILNTFNLTITDILPTQFEEYQADFYKFVWLQPKPEDTQNILNQNSGNL